MGLLDHPLQLVTLLFILSVLPLIVVMGTSFLKLSVVFSLLRNALGTQQIPPNIAIYGLALILTVFIMAPVGMAIQENVKANPIKLESADFAQQVEQGVLKPYREFLQKHASYEQVRFFSGIGHKIWPEKYANLIPDDSIVVLMPAFTVSQLIEAFKIGLLLYLPFVAIDLIVSNILLAMGMMMVSPMTIALPFKLLVFVLVNGWERLLGQLVLSYA
ncbi:EscR/YscR/HrcR family type III secretion system export apparatus protein [Chitinimonas arctica]|uniref:EscR/YscR/HrcR family type III secretion system export apparatus protein n=1 Tax=Chitinimonas arctica TaxID=2594795 RepID=A0A516S9Q5_9NEIS|nr:type III secretion system export apparatus subunit SctR [Chitinimonas arctica]QDQ24867.1 EscR/YscR/HrcR family type III secretion system export apparatus protein [Chitinimonas arctica]